MYFTSDTTIVFLPGDHVLDVNTTVDNVARLTMRGESSSDNIATVVRNGSVGFSFTNVVNFNIYSLAFTSYNKSWSYGSHPASNSALLLQSTQNAKLVNCSFHDNLGTALTVHNTNITLTGNNEFTHNQCGCESFSERCNLGCAITALNSNLIFAGNNIFPKNRHNNVGVSEMGAGAIFAVASLLHFTGTSNFIDNVKSTRKKQNHAHGGGAIYVTNNTVLNFHGTNNFINNSANNKGGAIYTSHNTVLSLELATSSTTMYMVLEVQFTQSTILYLPSMEPTISSATMYIEVVLVVLEVQFTQSTILYIPSMEPTISSTTQHWKVVQYMQKPTSY